VYFFIKFILEKGQADFCLYTHSQIISEKGQNIEKKQQISAKEYMRLVENADKSLKELKKRRMCLLYKKTNLIIDTYTEVDGCPSILKVQHEDTKHEPTLPAFIKIVRDITDEKVYSNFSMAKLDWKMPPSDKELIQGIENENVSEKKEIFKDNSIKI